VASGFPRRSVRQVDQTEAFLRVIDAAYERRSLAALHAKATPNVRAQ